MNVRILLKLSHLNLLEQCAKDQLLHGAIRPCLICMYMDNKIVPYLVCWL